VDLGYVPLLHEYDGYAGWPSQRLLADLPNSFQKHKTNVKHQGLVIGRDVFQEKEAPHGQHKPIYCDGFPDKLEYRFVDLFVFNIKDICPLVQQ
jgi:hypothetical protein